MLYKSIHSTNMKWSKIPDQLPCRSPERPQNTPDFLARPLFPLSLQERRKANHDKEPARVGKLSTVPEAPESQNVYDGRYEISAHNRSVPTRNRPPWLRAIHHKEMAEGLVPALAPYRTRPVFCTMTTHSGPTLDVHISDGVLVRYRTPLRCYASSW